MTVYAQISKATDLKYTGGNDQKFLVKLVAKIDGLSDKVWEDFEEDTQNWCNAASKAVDQEEDIPVPDGMTDDEADEEEAGEEEAKPARRVSAKANGKAKPDKKAAKPVKGKAKAAPADDDDDDDEAEDEPAKPAKPIKGKAKGKPIKAAKAEKPTKKAKAKKGGLTGKRARLFEDDQRVIVLSKSNPKREGTASADRFDFYVTGKKGMTVREALDAGVSSGDLKHDSDKGFIEIK